MNDIAENICVFLMVAITILLVLWFRYIQADGVVPCMFDYSPRSCATLQRIIK